MEKSQVVKVELPLSFYDEIKDIIKTIKNNDAVFEYTDRNDIRHYICLSENEAICKLGNKITELEKTNQELRLETDRITNSGYKIFRELRDKLVGMTKWQFLKWRKETKKKLSDYELL